MLKDVKAVDAPPFMFTRIQEKINAIDEAAPSLKWTVAFGMVVIIAVNVFLFSRPGEKPRGVANDFNGGLTEQIYSTE